MSTKSARTAVLLLGATVYAFRHVDLPNSRPCIPRPLGALPPTRSDLLSGRGLSASSTCDRHEGHRMPTYSRQGTYTSPPQSCLKSGLLQGRATRGGADRTQTNVTWAMGREALVHPLDDWRVTWGVGAHQSPVVARGRMTGHTDFRSAFIAFPTTDAGTASLAHNMAAERRTFDRHS